MLVRKTNIFATSLFLLVVGACAVRQASQPELSPSLNAEGERHWVHDERLRTIMADLEKQRRTSWPQEIQDEYAALSVKERTQALDQACVLAERLAESAGRIPATVANIKMPEVDRRSFLAQAETLHDQAKRLGDASAAGDVDRMRDVLASINETCQSCHQRFRDISGPIDER